MYIGLLNNSVEPDSSTCYARVYADWSRIAFFDNPNGFGLITHIALFETATGGNPIDSIKLLEPVDCRAGTIPVVRNKELILAKSAGMTAQIIVNADGVMNS